MKIIFFILMSVVLLFSKELVLDDLLSEYKNSEELYLKTKKENAGHLIIFSRSDLDKMQAYTLNDVLKTIRTFNLQVKINGKTTLVKSGTDQIAHNPVKIFVNSHELNSATFGNALTQYGKMGLYYIDHIEIYQAGNSVTFGNEPGNMIIKLYTKEPSRENSTSAQVSVDTRGSLNLRAVDARVIGDYSYLSNIDISKNNYKTYNTNGYDLSRDGGRGQFYFKFSKEGSYEIETGASVEKHDSLNGIGNNAPLEGNIDSKDFYIHATKYFDNNLKVMLSLTREELDVYNEDANSIKLVDGSKANKISINMGTDVYYASIEKKFIYGKNDLLVGANFKHQKFKISEYKYDDISPVKIWGPTKMDIYMLYLENLYNLDSNNLISFSAKLDHYKNSFSKSSTEDILRLGYVSLIDKDWTFKLFALKSYVYPIFRQTTFSPNTNINPELHSAVTKTLTAELIYKLNNTTVNISAGKTSIEDALSFNQTEKKYVNSAKTNSFKRLFARVHHIFDLNNKLTLEYYKFFKDKYLSPGNGGLVQLFNKVCKFDIYNELVYRSAYTSIDGIKMSAGYNYSLGVIYPVNRQLEIKLKVENLLDAAHETHINGVDIPAIERRGLLTMEYIF